MKKLIALLAVLAIAAPAVAAGPEWNFYGSARMATFWHHDDYGKARPNGDMKDDGDLEWDFQTNSRLGARVKADKVSGRVEMALPSANTHDGLVETRLLYGTWKFADNASLKVGKDWSLSSQLLSSQTGYGDWGLATTGMSYGRRVPQITLQVAGFELSLIQPNSFTQAPPAAGDTDEWLPKIEAKYGMNLGMFNFAAFGGFQTYEVEENGGALSKDVDVTSWIAGGDVGFNIGAVYVKAAGSLGENWRNARWNDLGGVAGVGYSAASSAAFLGPNDKVKDAFSWQAALLAGFKLTDALSFEVGGGYRVDDPAFAKQRGLRNDGVWTIYANSTIALAKGVYLVPEVAYFDMMDDRFGDDEGYQWYAGAKWQIDF